MRSRAKRQMRASEVYEHWLRLLDAGPKVVVISVGTENRFGHPCDDVLDRSGALPVHRTDEQGVVELVTDGVQVWVETEQ
ncbi:MAG: hypothetical protein ACE5OS_04340 [Anaerolineae bacterium]